MKHFCVLLIVTLVSIGAGPRDALLQARQFYNHQQYDAAIEAATEARRRPELADAGGLVLARALLERFRQSANPADQMAARDALTKIDPARLGAADRLELMIGLGESLYFDDQAGAAAEEFELALAHLDGRDPSARERVLDWWASALDRQAQLGPEAQQGLPYARIVRKMEEELRRDAGSAAASYWLVAGARGSGDVERAWDAAIAGWVRAALAGDRRSALRADLDRIVRQAIIPELARQTSAPGDPTQAIAAMRVEWTAPCLPFLTLSPEGRGFCRLTVRMLPFVGRLPFSMREESSDLFDTP